MPTDAAIEQLTAIIQQQSELLQGMSRNLARLAEASKSTGARSIDVNPEEVLNAILNDPFETRKNGVQHMASNICTTIETLLQGLDITNEQAEVASAKINIQDNLFLIKEASDYQTIEASLNSMQSSITDMTKLACVKEYPKTNNIFKKLLNAIKTLIRWVCEQKGFKKLEMALYSKSQNTLHGFAQQLGEESTKVKQYRLNP